MLSMLLNKIYSQTFALSEYKSPTFFTFHKLCNMVFPLEPSAKAIYFMQTALLTKYASNMPMYLY